MTNALIDLSNNLAGTVERAGRSVLSIAEGGQHRVSGTVWRDGVVVTAEHTIRASKEPGMGKDPAQDGPWRTRRSRPVGAYFISQLDSG